MIVRGVTCPDAAAGVAAVFGREEVMVWLDSARAGDDLARWSFAGSPGVTGEILTYAVGQGSVTVTGPRPGEGAPVEEPGTIWDALRRRIAPFHVDRRGADPAEPAPWEGLVDGWVGYLGYELKGDLGATNRHRSSLPDAVWVRCERLLVLDHITGEAWLVGHGADAEEWVAWAERRLADLVTPAPTALEDHAGGHGASQEARTGEGWVEDVPRLLVRSTATYLRDVELCLEALRRGESYEVCLTNTAVTGAPAHGWETYLALRRHNPAPHAAYLRLPGVEVLSASPELFLHATPDGWLSTKPIKGTVARHTAREEDEAAARALAADPKTRAENLMIVDLLRNDLSRVCDPATVQVPRLMAIESYATVHQMVTTVRGRLRDGGHVVDAVAACFPGGSMTGAPKHRTMEIIDELETRARGVYSGAIGYLDRAGAMDLSVVIRTAVVADGEATVGAGGAIVLDSDPEAETQEMLLKARSVLPALLGHVTR